MCNYVNSCMHIHSKYYMCIYADFTLQLKVYAETQQIIKYWMVECLPNIGGTMSVKSMDMSYTFDLLQYFIFSMLCDSGGYSSNYAFERTEEKREVKKGP